MRHVICVIFSLTAASQILNYLRDTADAIDVQFTLGQADLQALMREAQYYRLSDLRHRISEVTNTLSVFKRFFFIKHIFSTVEFMCLSLLAAMIVHDFAATGAATMMTAGSSLPSTSPTSFLLLAHSQVAPVTPAWREGGALKPDGV